ncbi:MAG: carbon-nitrogen family hydrolase [Lachnospiraceae bacterium]|nr:carbon-nitrogen family hydrolase [Lachnospiraceae bacterium]
MRVALGQLDMVWEDRDASIQRAEPLIAEAASADADIIIFPEMSFTGVSLNIEKVAEPLEQSSTISQMKSLATRYQIAIGFGWAASSGQGSDLATNRFTIIDNTGTKIGEYTKLHPFTYGGESECYAKGDEIVTVPFLGRKIGLFICYDLRFPEIFHIAAREADIMFVIANWPEIRREHWQTLLRARAIETQSYVVGVNCVGSRDGSAYSGDSMAVDSIGNILGVLSGKEGILICDLDDRAWNLRKKFSTARDRREKLYSSYFGMG